MSWVSNMLSSTIGRKLLMSLTGIFLITFLVIHLIGNTQLFYADGGYAFNKYALFMTTNPLIKTVSYLLYLSILAHVIVSIFLTVKNRSARPQSYAVSSGSSNSTWQSRNMGILGTIILIFLVVHLQNFWYQFKWGHTPYARYEVTEGGDVIKHSLADVEITEELLKEEGVYKDLYKTVEVAFQEWWLVALYLISMVGLAFHLAHGFQSAFQTLGINHNKYTPFIKKLGLLFSIIVPAAFASLPLYFYFIK